VGDIVGVGVGTKVIVGFLGIAVGTGVGGTLGLNVGPPFTTVNKSM